MGENAFHRWLRNHLPSHADAAVPIGDDAAVLRWVERDDCVVTTDLLADGVHFHTGQHTPQQIGHKALGVNLSDLAAMAARPVAAVVSLLLPHDGDAKLAEGIIQGMLPLAEQFHVAIAGGDTNSWKGQLVVNVTALGQTIERGPLRRDGAQPGDGLLVTGELGGSILGKHVEFCPRVNEAIALHSNYALSAAMDISDGLLLDLSRLVESSGCGVELDVARIPISPAAGRLTELEADGRSALEHACEDGEDFELLLVAGADEAERLLLDQPVPVRLSKIGRFVHDAGLWIRDENGNRTPMTPRGYEHRWDG